jgi:hypothetical protein
MATLQILQAIRQELAEVRREAQLGGVELEKLRGVSAEAAGEIASHRSTLLSLVESSSLLLAKTRSDLAGLSDTVGEAQRAVFQSVDAITSKSQTAVAAVHEASAQIGTATEALRNQTATRFDDLQQLLKDGAGAWDQAVLQQIEAVKLGIVSIEDFLSKFGDAVVEGQRLREYLSDLDLGTYQKQVRDLVQGLHDGSLQISEVLEFLGESQLEFAKQLKSVIDLFQAGKVTLERVAEVVAQVKRLFPGSQFDDLAEQLLDSLTRGGG